MKTFADIVEEIKGLSIEEKQELHSLLNHILADARRAEILQHHKETLDELKSGKLTFYNSPEDLLKTLNEG